MDNTYLPKKCIFDSSQRSLDVNMKRIIYMPVQDMDIPDRRYTKIVINQIIKVLKKGEHVHIQCIGGHGRTGTIIACLISTVNKTVTNPVKWVKDNYCKKAVESVIQYDFIANFTKTEIYHNSHESFILPKLNSVIKKESSLFPLTNNVVVQREKSIKSFEEYMKCRDYKNTYTCDWSYSNHFCTKTCEISNTK